MAVSVLKNEKIAKTAYQLSMRIHERFPNSGLFDVSQEIIAMADAARQLAPAIGRPNYPVRFGVGVLITIILAIVISLIVAAFTDISQFTKANIVDILTAIESGTNEIVLIGLGILFLVSLETRIKRARTLEVIHQLRSLAHVIDMHQLTKDPGYYRDKVEATKSSPERVLSLPQLVRYLDYCSELLSVTSKIAALYAQEMNDSVVLAAVGDHETLVTGLCQKIWQKVDIAGEIQQETS